MFLFNSSKMTFGRLRKLFGRTLLSAPTFKTGPFCSLCFNAINSCSTDASSELEFIRLLKETAASRASKKVHYKMVKELTENDLLERFRNLERLGVVGYQSIDSLPLLSQHPFTILNRIEVLLEAGFRREAITASRLAKYIRITRQSIASLKVQGLIPESVDVMSSILQHVDIDPTCYPEEMLDRSASIIKIRKEIVKAFMKKKFGFSDEDFEVRGQLFTRLYNKSFSTINKNIRLMENEIGMPTETLRRHIYLLSTNSANMEAILREVDSIGDIEIHTALNCRPKILANTCANLIQILRLFKEYNIPISFNHAVLKVFTLSYKTVKTRFAELDNVELLSLYKDHPRVMTLILVQDTAKKRLKLLEDANIHLISLHSIISTRRRFEKFVNEGYHLVGRTDLLHYLVNRYGNRYKEIKAKLERHPFWRSVPLVTVGRNQRFLSKHLSKDDILRCPLVLFYPTNKVEEEFYKLESREGIDCCKENGRIKPEFIASLLTYYIEKDTNFCFQGLWPNEGITAEPVDAPHAISNNSL